MDLSETEQAALDAIKGGPRAWSSVAGLVAAGHSPEDLGALMEHDLVERWGKPHVGELAEDLVALTPIALVRLGLRVDEDLRFEAGEVLEVPVYREVGAPEWPFRIPQGFGRPLAMPFPEGLVDPNPGPAELVEFLIDEFNGLPFALFAGDGGAGIPIVRDRRAGARAAARTTPAARAAACA